MRFARKPLLLCALALLMLLGGCDSSHLGEIKSAAISPDGEYAAVVHRFGDKLLLSVFKTAGSEIHQMNIAGPKVLWLGKNLVCETLIKGTRRIAVFKPGNWAEPLFLSEYISKSPLAANGKLFYLALKDGVWEVFSVSSDNWIETPFTSDGRNKLAFTILPNGDAILIVRKKPNRTPPANARTLIAVGLGTEMGRIPLKPLDTPDIIGEFPSIAKVEYYDAALGVNTINDDILFAPGDSLTFEPESGLLSFGAPLGFTFLKLRIKKSRGKLKLKIEPVTCPVKNVLSVNPAIEGLSLATENGLLFWDGGRNADWVGGAYPWSIAAEFGSCKGGRLVALSADSGPPSQLALLAADDYKLLPLAGFQAKNARAFYIAHNLYERAQKLDSVALPANAPMVKAAEPHRYPKKRRVIPAAEMQLAQGKTQKALDIYLERADEFPLRIGEIHLFHLSNRTKALEWFSKVSEPAGRKRVDLYIIVATMNEKTKLSYTEAFKALSFGDFKGVVESGAYYFRKMNSDNFDPWLAETAVDYLNRSGKGDEANKLLDKSYETGMKSRFSAEIQVIAARHFERSGNLQQAARLLLDISIADRTAARENCLKIIRFALNKGEAVNEAHRAVEMLRQFKLPFEEAVRLQVWQMLLTATIQRTSRTDALIPANHLAWGAYIYSYEAVEAAFWSIILADSVSPEDGNAVLGRFCKNPRITVRTAVPRIAEIAFRNAVSLLPPVCFSKGVSSLPNWFYNRCYIIRNLPELAGVLPVGSLAFLCGEEFDESKLCAEFTASEQGELFEAIRNTAIVLSLAAGKLPKAVTDRELPIELIVSYPGGPQDINLSVNLNALPSDYDCNILLQTTLQASLNPALLRPFRLFTYLEGNKATSDIANLLPVPPPHTSKRCAAFINAFIFGDWDSITSALVEYGSEKWTLPLWKLLRAVGMTKGETLVVLEVARKWTDAQDKNLKANSLDTMCAALHRLERTVELEKAALLLQECADFKGLFRRSPLHAKILAGFYSSKGDEEKRREWLIEWLQRGGAVNLTDSELKAFIDANGEVFEQWATSEPPNAAMFIYLRDEGIREYLLGKCGKAREAVSQELKALLLQEDEEEPAEPEDG